MGASAKLYDGVGHTCPHEPRSCEELQQMACSCYEDCWSHGNVSWWRRRTENKCIPENGNEAHMIAGDCNAGEKENGLYGCDLSFTCHENSHSGLHANSPALSSVWRNKLANIFLEDCIRERPGWEWTCAVTMGPTLPCGNFSVYDTQKSICVEL